MVRRFTLSVDDALGERIEENKSKFNMSEIFRKAMASEIEKIEGARKSVTGELDMEAIISRLKSEKEKMESEAYQMGFEDGKRWALTARYEDLVYAVNDFAPWDNDYDITSMFRDEVLGDYLLEAMPEYAEYRGGDDDEQLPTAGEKWVDGWTDAVNAFWEAVSDKLL